MLCQEERGIMRRMLCIMSWFEGDGVAAIGVLPLFLTFIKPPDLPSVTHVPYLLIFITYDHEAVIRFSFSSTPYLNFYIPIQCNILCYYAEPLHKTESLL